MKTYCGLLALGLLLGACDSDKTPPDRSPATAPVDYLDAINQGKKRCSAMRAWRK